MTIYDITPVPCPRMTRRDKWKKRPCVLRYFAFRDEVKLKRLKIPHSGSHIIFTIPMPKNWSKKDKIAHNGRPHQKKPDIDNLLKALLDSVYNDDSAVWCLKVSKIWGYNGSIEVIT